LRCERFDKLIYLFLDGKLNQGKERELKEHLSECERCGKRLAFLESVEGKAKGIKAKEPPQEYWDTFSSRVREKIVAQQEKAPAFSLKNALESVFSFSPLKIRVAAGVISVVLVFIIGKLYVDYRGREIVPSKEVIQTKKSPQLDIMEMEREEEFPIEEARKKVKPSHEKSEIGKQPATAVQQEGKALPPKRAGDEKEALLREKKIPPRPEVVEEKAVPAYAPALEAQTPEEIETPSERQLIPPESKPTGAGMEEGVEEKEVRKVAAPKEKAQKGEETVSKDVTVLTKPALRVSLAMDHYLVNEKTVPKIEEADTLMQADELRRTIQVWKAYIQENPSDSLTNQGYLQVAIGYYLLAKLSQDTTVISEGSKLMDEYVDQIEDRKVKEELSGKLKKIKALRKR